MIAAIGLDRGLHMDFGSYAGYGIPYQVVTASTPRSTVTFEYDEDSDHVGYPIPASPLIEGGSDRHILMVDKDACRLYELFAAQQVGGAWTAGSGATWDLRSNALRPETWTSADAAGLPILPGLVRYDEVAAGAIAHALRFTTNQTRTSYIYPARHQAGESASTSLPPMGLRVRLKAGYDTSRPVAAGARHRRGAQALRDDPRRQRLALVHHRRERPALRRRRACTSSTSSPAATSRSSTRPGSSTDPEPPASLARVTGDRAS